MKFQDDGNLTMQFTRIHGNHILLTSKQIITILRTHNVDAHPRWSTHSLDTGATYTLSDDQLDKVCSGDVFSSWLV